MLKILNLEGKEARTENGGYPESIKLLEQALEEARQGKVAAVAIILVHPNREIDTWISDTDIGRHTMIAGCMYMVNELMNGGG